jgi:membrane protease YdiL (CAAX protease family)
MARASVLLGMIWACWHIPQFFLRESDTFGQSFWVYALQVTAMSVAMAWLYAHTHGSLLLTMLMHASINNLKDMVPAGLPGASNSLSLHASAMSWLGLTLLWIAGAYFLATMPANTNTDDTGEARAVSNNP